MVKQKRLGHDDTPTRPYAQIAQPSFETLMDPVASYRPHDGDILHATANDTPLDHHASSSGVVFLKHLVVASREFVQAALERSAERVLRNPST